MDVNNIKELFERSIQVKQELVTSGVLDALDVMGSEIAKAIENGNKLMLCGNGGSAADAQHLAAEMLVRLRPDHNRQGVPAIALTQDVSTLTACGNDYGYDSLFERMVRTLGREGDILIAITTSGKSKNITYALESAKSMNIKTFGFLGGNGGDAIGLCDKSYLVPSFETGRIQEAHITGGHALMENVEDKLIESGYLTLV